MTSGDAHRPNLLRSVGVLGRAIFVIMRRRIYPSWPTDHFELTLLSRIVHAVEWRYERHASQMRSLRARGMRVLALQPERPKSNRVNIDAEAMSAPQERTEPRPFDPRTRSQALCAAADAAIAKGDLELAQRLLIQADVDDPRNPFPEERLAWVDHEIARFETLKSTATSEGRKFDFLYTPTLRGLSTELSTLLPLHPEVFSVPKHELDHAIEKRSELALLAKYQRLVLNGHKRLRAGLVQHAYIAGQLGEPEVAKRLANVTTRKLFIHGVRDPVRLAISDFNHELISRHGAAYVFWPVYPQTPFCWAIYELEGGLRYKRVRTLKERAKYWRDRARHYRQGLATSRGPGLLSEMMFMHGLFRFSLDAGVIEERLDDALSRARHFAVGQTYAQHFDAWVPIDLERPASAHESVISRVLGAIGVDPKFDHPAFHASEGTMAHRAMVQNWIAVEASGHVLHLGLGYADRSMFSNTFPFCEILPFDLDPSFSDLGPGRHRLCVSVHRDQWRLLPRDVRIRLTESNELVKFRDEVLIPAWIESYRRWKTIVGKYLLRELPPAVLFRLRAQIGPDLERFLKRHPQFEQIWPSTRALVGH
jgi:hypothetical protein